MYKFLQKKGNLNVNLYKIFMKHNLITKNLLAEKCKNK